MALWVCIGACFELFYEQKIPCSEVRKYSNWPTKKESAESLRPCAPLSWSTTIIIFWSLWLQILMVDCRTFFTHEQVSAVSTVVNWGTGPKPFIFRNYNHNPSRISRYAGSSGYQLWQAVRASSAAPGYFQEFPLHNDIHQVWRRSVHIRD